MAKAQHQPTQRSAAHLLDRLVGYFSPTQGLRRLAAREQLSRAYEGASRLDGWRPKRAGASAVADHQADAREIRHRARALHQNVPYITNAVNAVVAARVGTGIVPVWADEAIARHWSLWVRHADFDGLLNFYGLQAKASRTCDLDGSVLIRKHVRKLGAIVPLQLQLLEIDFLDQLRNEVMASGNEIISGIEFNRRGQRVAYWLFERHPGDAGLWNRGRSGISMRVPADEIIHLFNPSRPGQQDGISRLAAVIPRVRDLQTYMDAELQRKQLETRLGVLAVQEDLAGGTTPSLPGELNAAGGSGVQDLGELAGGGIVALPPGMSNPVFVEPKAVPGYVEYVKQGWKEVAAGYGCPYELMTGDMTEVNFSSSRVRTNQFRREIEMEQWGWFVPMLCGPIADWWLSALSLVAQVPAQKAAIDWTTPKWASPNPVQDVASDLSAIKGGLQSISEVIRQRGYDPELVFTELEKDFKRLDSMGILPLMASMWGAQSPLELLGKTQEKT